MSISKVWIFLAIVFASGIVRAESQPRVPIPSNGNSASAHIRTLQARQTVEPEIRGTNASPLVVRVVPTLDDEKVAERKIEQENEKATLDKLMAWATVSLAAITFFLALFTAKLWKSTGQLVAGAEDTAKKQLRAYLSAQPNYVFSFGDSKLAEIRFAVVNHGKTPASMVKATGLVDILPFPLPANYPFQISPIAAKSCSVVHPNGGFQTHLISTRLFTTTEIAKAVEGTEFRIYAFGKVIYTDVFGDIRETSFCSSVFGDENLNAVAGGIPIPNVEIKFEPAEQHNEAT